MLEKDKINTDLQIPFDDYGNMTGYPGYNSKEWRDNKTFNATLLFKRFDKGRSRCNFVWEDADTGVTYNMFLRDGEKLIMAGMFGLIITGSFAFRKQGANYGLVKLMWDMPFYDYKREDGSVFEHYQSITSDALTICPTTGQPVTRIISGGAAFKFKGTGFYTTDFMSRDMSLPGGFNKKDAAAPVEPQFGKWGDGKNTGITVLVVTWRSAAV